MLDRIRGDRFLFPLKLYGSNSRPRVRRSNRDIRPEILESRQLLTASLASLNGITVPAQMGYQVPLDGSGSTGASQNYTVTSSNPDIAATVAQGSFFSVGVTHTAISAGDVSFSGTLVFQLFDDLTGNTTSQIKQFVSNGYYVGKDFTRIVKGFPGATDYVAQAGGPTTTGSGSSGQPGTPFANQPVQQLAFTGPGLLAMANAGGTATNDTQFFVTTGTPGSLNYNYTIFGQLVSGQSLLADMTKVLVKTNPVTNELSLPQNRITITSASISESSVHGVIHVDTTQAKAGETATITVTATDPGDGSQVTRSFNVVVGKYNGPTAPPINFRPFAGSPTASVFEDTTTPLGLLGASGNPTFSSTESFSYTLVSQPQHGKITNFNATTGAFFYTPDPDYVGTDSFQYQVKSTNSARGPVTTSNPGTMTIAVKPGSSTSLPASTSIPTTAEVPAVTADRVEVVRNKRGQVVRVVVHFTGPLNASGAGQKGNYRLATPGKRGSYTARNAGVIAIGRSVYSDSAGTVTLTPKKPFSLKKPVQLLIRGSAPTGILDSRGRFIDGAKTGQAGSDGVAILSANGVTIGA